MLLLLGIYPRANHVKSVIIPLVYVFTAALYELARTWLNKAEVNCVRVVSFKSMNPAVISPSITLRHIPYKEGEVHFKCVLLLKIHKV